MFKTQCKLSTAKTIVITESVLHHQRLEANTDRLLIDELSKHGFDLYDRFWFFYDMTGNLVILAWKATWWERLYTRIEAWIKGYHAKHK